jgi:uncharacterized membrane protein
VSTAAAPREPWPARLYDRVPAGGLLLGLIFFSLALTPSLIPRQILMQGVLCGAAFAAGYGIGVSLEWLWDFLQIPRASRPIERQIKFFAIAGGGILALAFLWLSTGWQNSILVLMGMPAVETNQPVFVTLIAIIPAMVLIGLGTLFVWGVRWVSLRLRRIIPRRVAFVAGVVIVGMLAGGIVDGIILRWTLATADRFYADLDALAGLYEEPPANPLLSGSAESLISWDTIGLDARTYVRSGPTAAEIEAITGRPAELPLRVYVGLRSADSPEARAELALAEMIRVGAFERSILVLIMPVGTGWVDPPAIDTLEMLHGGDVASVAVQYSYLTSWLSLVVEPEVGTATAQALFTTVYRHWTGLDPATRPKLYLHGLSLGAYASQASATIYDVLADPYSGAFWVGTPFATPGWRSATASRDAGTPSWRPRIGDGSVVRFFNQTEGEIEAGQWGPLRIVYLQYPSDPIVFFEPTLVYRPPPWLTGPRPPDVSAQLNWYPVVTALQVLADMALAQTSPIGFGHVYAPQHYFDGWVTLTEPEGWTPEALATLRARLSRSGPRQLIEGGWFRDAAS